MPSGLAFRNDFHLLSVVSAELFVPCGGRPEAVNVSNVHRLYDDKGAPRFRAIVEGANLFFTEQARLHLEKSGVIVFKDASANKGGVTSSSPRYAKRFIVPTSSICSCFAASNQSTWS